MKPESILVVDDQLAKYEALQQFASSFYSAAAVTWIKNYRQAQSNLLSFRHDLLILDMSFEVHGASSEDMSLDGLAGIHVLQFMWRSRIRTPTVICTSHLAYSDPNFGQIEGIGGLRSYMRSYFSDTVLGCIWMGADVAAWQGELKEIVDHA